MLIRIGTRSSTLSRTQTDLVVKAFRLVNENIEIEVKSIFTTADRILNKSLHEIGGKGLFLKELEQALKEDKIDLAVHSLKDVPGILNPEFLIAAVLERADPRDILVIKDKFLFNNILDIPKFHSIGTSSIRRKMLINRLRPDIEVKFIRGNIERRLEQLICSKVDSLILAKAAIDRMDLKNYDGLSYHPISVSEFLPSTGQGTIAIETLSENFEIINLCKKINNLSSWYIALAERSFLEHLGADCSDPVAAYAEYKEGKIYGRYMFFDKKNNILKFHSECGEIDQAASLGRKAAKILLQND